MKGADHFRVLRRILMERDRLVALGVAVGLAVAFIPTRLLANQL